MNSKATQYATLGSITLTLALAVVTVTLQAGTKTRNNLLAAPNAEPTAASQRKNKFDLTGVWSGDDGGTYYVRQIGNRVWWTGMSEDRGRSFTNVFCGSWIPNMATEEPADYGSVQGEWADVPRGGILQNGRLRLSLRFSGELWKQQESGGFGGSVWKRIG